jgi:hypothetical protein
MDLSLGDSCSVYVFGRFQSWTASLLGASNRKVEASPVHLRGDGPTELASYRAGPKGLSHEPMHPGNQFCRLAGG